MTNLFSLDGKMALITGAGRGIGAAIARAYAAAGADVALVSRTAGEVETIAGEIRALGRRAISLALDLRVSGAAEEAVARTVDSFGRIDLLVTSSGTIIRKPALETSEADWQTVVGLNLKARFFLAKAAAARMQSTGGAIIHIASLSTFFGIPNQMAYVASNGGVGAMTRAQAVEWADAGIRVNAIAPGSILTQQTEGLLADPAVRASRLAKIPLNRLGTPEDIAGAAVFLASDAAAYITGHILVVDGGWLAAGGELKG